MEYLSLFLEFTTTALLVANAELVESALSGQCGSAPEYFTTMRDTMKHLIATGPVLIAVCSGIRNHFAFRIKFIILRSAAARLREQIFRYRTSQGRAIDASC